MFYDQKFPFLDHLENNWLDIKDEFLSLSRQNLVHWPGRFLFEANWGVKNWHIFALYILGTKIEANCALCPKTTSVIEKIPQVKTVAFSLLSAHTSIPPHIGDVDSFYRCTLGLIVPPDSGIKLVSGESRSWQPGKIIMFQDTVEHEAWNNSCSDKLILIADFVKPELEYIPYFYQDYGLQQLSAERILTRLYITEYQLVQQEINFTLREDYGYGKRKYPLDIWIMLQTPNKKVLFLTSVGELSSQEQPAIPNQLNPIKQDIHLELSMVGEYTVVILGVENGQNPLSGSVFLHRSNVIIKMVALRCE
ncbi:aspartyl/asparaginyl beta-hydroxylase domain-containing protein [Candidatus Halobeggiatoa sp. HSG11]|nr:aspartyl/asparaginyl beta-hydroxylase domain-containing protein [Candidatus Halobeggiatoa sp. HSG11]